MSENRRMSDKELAFEEIRTLLSLPVWVVPFQVVAAVQERTQLFRDLCEVLELDEEKTSPKKLVGVVGEVSDRAEDLAFEVEALEMAFGLGSS